jgi:hypothetical protein
MGDMPSKHQESQPEKRSYQFITDPTYDETLSGRVRSACITCSCRKVKCSGRIPCKSCLNYNLVREGFKPMTRTRWEKRRRKKALAVPLSVRTAGGGDAQTQRQQPASAGLKSGERQFYETLFPEEKGVSDAESTISPLDGASYSMPPFPPPWETGNATSMSNAWRSRPDTVRSMPTPELRSNDMTPPQNNQAQNNTWQSQPCRPESNLPAPDQDFNTTRPLPTAFQYTSPLILAAESLEQQARLLRQMAAEYRVSAPDKAPLR